jgi:septal ring factor EnvC (AmiA/AmiB activator)
MGRFFNELEDWLSAFARFNDSSSSNAEQTALASGMSEEAARAAIALSQSISNGEDNRERLLVQISQLTGTMASLNEALADDRRIREHLAQLNANIMQLSEDLRADRNQQTDIVASELRGLSSSIAAMIDVKTLSGKGE